MSKLLNLGISLAVIIEASTVNPARAIGRDDLWTLHEGTVGDITVLELLEGEFEYQDTAGETMVGRQKLVSVLALINGQPITTEHKNKDSDPRGAGIGLTPGRG
jgi:dihydroorotase